MHDRTFSSRYGLAAAIAAIALLPHGAVAAQEQVIYRFTGGSDGAAPVGGLISDSSGNLYGVARGGGQNSCAPVGNCGTAFELSPQKGGGWTFTVLHEFSATDGGNPNSALVMDASGNLYGTNGALVFELSPANGGWIDTVLYTFGTNNKGAARSPKKTHKIVDVEDATGVTLGSDGNLYGFATRGGYCVNEGKIGYCLGGAFELTRPLQQGGTWTETVIWQPEKLTPLSGPGGPGVFDANGNFYGEALGLVFALEPGNGAWKPVLIYSPNAVSALPAYVFDSSGNLYSAGLGYPSAADTVFELTPKTRPPWKEKTLYTFPDPGQGEESAGGLVFDAGGNLYGLTVLGGASNSGVAYELSPSKGNWNESLIYSFAGGSDGANPSGSLIAIGGAVFGVTSAGGNGGCSNNAGCGSVFEITP